MLVRERGWNFETDKDIWSKSKDSAGIVCYRNNITGHIQFEEPVDFKGGILADDMGLGKSLSIISLVAADRDSESTDGQDHGKSVETFPFPKS